MPTNVFEPEWRDAHAETKWPFAESALLLHPESGYTIPPRTFLDAIFYVDGNTAGLYLREVELGNGVCTLRVGDETGNKATTTFDTLDPEDEVYPVVDLGGRPAGAWFTTPSRLASFLAWKPGLYTFRRNQTELAAPTQLPIPQTAVGGIRVNGKDYAGDVWLAAGRGVVFRVEDALWVDPLTQTETPYTRIRVDVVGEPLARRARCEDATGQSDQLPTKRYVQFLRLTARGTTVTLVPDEFGHGRLYVGDRIQPQTALRLGFVNHNIIPVTWAGGA